MPASQPRAPGIGPLACGMSAPAESLGVGLRRMTVKTQMIMMLSIGGIKESAADPEAPERNMITAEALKGCIPPLVAP
jgi:hypothetical protein